MANSIVASISHIKPPIGANVQCERRAQRSINCRPSISSKSISTHDNGRRMKIAVDMKNTTPDSRAKCNFNEMS